MTTEPKAKYLLVVQDEHYYNYGDDCDIITRLAPLPDSLTPIIWELTSDEYISWADLFRSNSKYRGYHFVQVAVPDVVTIESMTADLEKHREAVIAAEAKRRKAEEDRKRRAAEKKAERDAAKLLKNEDKAREMYEALKAQFEKGQQ